MDGYDSGKIRQAALDISSNVGCLCFAVTIITIAVLGLLILAIKVCRVFCPEVLPWG
jgi:hypothetical protein